MLHNDGFVFPKKKAKNRRRGKVSPGFEGGATETITDIKSKINESLFEITESQFFVDFTVSLNRCLTSLENLEHVEQGNQGESTALSETANESCTTTGNAGSDKSAEQTADSITDTAMTVAGPSADTDDVGNSPNRIKDIVCYGLGNFTSCAIARYQLALLLALREKLKVELQNCYMFDPRFTQMEKSQLEDIGLTMIAENEEGKRTCRQTTMFYMPHCDKPLYNNLLYANWSADLFNVIIIGNSFSSTVQNLPKRILESEASFIRQILPFTYEENVKNNFKFLDIFNDTSVHCFPKPKLNSAAKEFWENLQEPKYDSDNLGIILKT